MPRYELPPSGDVQPVKELPKPWETAPFWATLLSYIFTIVTLIFHTDFSDLIPALSLAASGIATAAYSVYQAWYHHTHAQSVRQYRGLVADSLAGSHIQSAFGSVGADMDQLQGLVMSLRTEVADARSELETMQRAVRSAPVAPPPAAAASPS